MQRSHCLAPDRKIFLVDEGQNGPLGSSKMTSYRAQTTESHQITSYSLSLIEVETELSLHRIMYFFSDCHLQQAGNVSTAKDIHQFMFEHHSSHLTP